MTKRKKWLIFTIIIITLVGLLYSCSKKSQPIEIIKVKRGTIEDKVIAVGNIVPKHTISVKSNISGIVGQVYHEEGDFIEQNALLLQVQPSPTPQSIADTHAEVEEQKANLQQSESHRKRLEQLVKLSLETPDKYALAVREVATNKARLEKAQQKLALIQNGEAKIAGKQIKTTIYSPVSGYILQQSVDVGDPVVPLTDMQAGTVLLSIANMQDLIFKGLVNEIDVAKISPGMVAEVNIAALPDTKIQGTLRKVDLQANKADPNITASSSNNQSFNVGFNIELNQLNFPKEVKLRAGYSAVAEIIIKKLENVLIIPERFLIFKDKKIFVNLVKKPDSLPILQEIKVGLSDGIFVEVIAGLDEGQTLAEDKRT